ncbi:hypothetical protein BLNAU_4118 [Blattamonas nauphoetae]|uniref:Uncharacterized protein n=1 Tax=Blattamonas nauphoetae TaxID=2049346 RepID=A0ABQ9YB81_9EUKA|nr:hypothetical protein BLNAU_4118 [Blattamonas nauphoetae]
MRDSNLLEEVNQHKMGRLIQSILQILNECLKNDISVVNRRMLHSSLSTLAKSSSLPKTIRVGIGQCLVSLESIEDGPFVLVDADELKSMEEVTRILVAQNATFEQSRAELERRSSEMTRHKNELETRIKELRVELAVEKRSAESERAKMEDEKKEMSEKMERMRMMMRTEWVGTEALQTLDKTAHTLTPSLITLTPNSITLISNSITRPPNSITQIIKLENGEWRTAFTLPIDEGEWELKIRGNNTFWALSVFFSLLIFSALGFVRYPLPENATQRHCGSYHSGIGGDFILWDGGMWKGGEFKPAGTNMRCDQVGQTAAIRVNMSTRTARLFVDDEEQPGIFTDIPSPLCLGITTGFLAENQSVEVLWLKQPMMMPQMPPQQQLISPNQQMHQQQPPQQRQFPNSLNIQQNYQQYSNQPLPQNMSHQSRSTLRIEPFNLNQLFDPEANQRRRGGFP